MRGFFVIRPQYARKYVNLRTSLRCGTHRVPLDGAWPSGYPLSVDGSLEGFRVSRMIFSVDGMQLVLRHENPRLG